jgi:phage-related baseplate assembly protein
MKTGMNEASFNDLLSMLDSKLGTYLSSDLVTVLQDEKFNTVIYRLTYSKDNEAVMRVVFDRSEPHQISGLWFDSPELRGP